MGLRSAKEDCWYGHIELWEKSGLSQEQYCKESEISFAAFGYWRKRYNKGLKDSLISNEDGEQAVQVSRSKLSHCPSVQILMPNGVRLGLNNDASSEILASILKMVQTC